jgi:hypothetical protein
MFVTTILPTADVNYTNYRKMSRFVPFFENFDHMERKRDGPGGGHLRRRGWACWGAIS